MNSLEHIVIFGVSSAIAEQVARQLVTQGSSVFCIARNQDKLQQILQDLRVRADNQQTIDGTVADLNRTEEHSLLIEQASRSLGHLDACLIAHGTLPDQQDCEQSYLKAAQEIHTNALSAISLLTHLANYFEPRNTGVIAAISSVAGDRGRQSNYVYGSAKGMLSVFLQGLRNRLHSKNVCVVTIKPGFVNTPMTANFQGKGPLWAQPEQIAKGIILAMRKGKGQVYLPWFWRWIMLIIKIIPETIFKRLSM